MITRVKHAFCTFFSEWSAIEHAGHIAVISLIATIFGILVSSFAVRYAYMSYSAQIARWSSEDEKTSPQVSLILNKKSVDGWQAGQVSISNRTDVYTKVEKIEAFRPNDLRMTKFDSKDNPDLSTDTKIMLVNGFLNPYMPGIGLRTYPNLVINLFFHSGATENAIKSGSKIVLKITISQVDYPRERYEKFVDAVIP